MLRSSPDRGTIGGVRTADDRIDPDRRPAATLTVGDVADEAGVAVSAVRFYEKHGLVSAVRTAGNQRRFTRGAACRIQVARVAQRVGLSVREIAEIMDGLPADPGPDDWTAVTETLVREAQARIDALQAALDDLGGDSKLCDVAPSV